LFVLLLVACVEAPLEGCSDFPADAVAPDGVLGGDDDCGYWQIAVDEHLYVSVPVTGVDELCSWTVGDGIELPYDPIFTSMENDIPKQTFDVLGMSSTGSGYAGFDVSCDAGSGWSARIQVL